MNLPEDPSIKKILIIRWSAIGDIVIATAMMEDVCRAFPNAEIHLNVLPAFASLFRNDTRFKKIISVDMKKRRGVLGLGAAFEWLSVVRQGAYDLIIDLHVSDRLHLLMALLQLTGSSSRYRAANHRVWPYNLGPADLPRQISPVTRMRAALQAAGIPTLTPRPVLHIDERNRTRVAALLNSHGMKPMEYGIFLPGSQAAGHLKRWGARKYADLAKELGPMSGKRILIIGGPDEIDECRRIADLAGDRVLNLCGQTELLDIVPLAEGARWIVANDTGTAHVASAANVRMVVICGPTDPERVKPMGDNVVAIQAILPCINCYQKSCDHHSCMREIQPSHVLEVLTQDAAKGIYRIPARILAPETVDSY